jgi:hypothetical protein
VTTPVFDGINEGNIVQQAQQRLLTLRLAVITVNEYKLWLDGYSVEDLGALSILQPQMLKDAFADAGDLYTIATGGTPVAAPPHDYMASIRRVMGPLF